MVNLFYPNEEAKNSKLKNIEYYKQLGFDQGLVFGTMRLFGSLGDSNKQIMLPPTLKPSNTDSRCLTTSKRTLLSGLQ